MDTESKPLSHTSQLFGNTIYPVNEIPKLEYETLHQIFESQADLHPDSTAVIFEQKKITYGELEAQANRLANYFYTKGVRRGSLVAILLHRSIDAYVAILATLKAGAAYVPLDPEYPPDRIAYIFKNSCSNVLVTDSNLAMRHATFCGAVIRIDADWKAINSQSVSRPNKKSIGVGPDDICYVIYTSGSTGKPKGVQIEHRSACNLVLSERGIYQVRQEDRVCQAASLSFDLSVEEIWLAFHSGATLVAARHGIANMGPDFSHFLSENKITVLSCVPTLLAMLEGELPHLRLVILGGEVCPSWLAERWTRTGRRLLNTYGPTETTVIATCTEIVPGKPITIGKVIPNYRAYVLDDALHPVPTGTVGQICIGGIGVARGYIGLEKETQARFIHDPFVAPNDLYARMYLTGDLGRFDDDGNLEFSGRADSQVKLRGFRIELAEIESVLMQLDNVKAAACTVREDVPGIQQLVGYVVTRDNVKIYAEDLRLHLKAKLPSFMIPSIIETIDSLPLLTSGKLDRNSLPPPQQGITSKMRPVRSPRTATEKKIFRVWESLFKLQSVSIDDDFFLDLGGHSLLAASAVSELRKDPQFSNISIVDLYEHPTIEAIAPIFDEHLTSRPVSKNRSETMPKRKHSTSLLAGIVQVVSMYAIFGFRAVEWVTPYLVFFFLIANHYPMLTAVTWTVISSIAVFPLLLGFAISIKWILLGQIRPGMHPLWGSYYLRWWFTQSIISSIPLDYLTGTPLLPFVFRLFGAKVGRDVHMDSAHLAAFDLISIGDNTSIDNEASILGYVVEDKMLVLGKIKIGSKCFVGNDCVLHEGTTMEDRSRLEDLSLLPRGSTIPEGKTWAGSPARPVSDSNYVQTTPPQNGRNSHRLLVSLLYGALVLVSPVILLAAMIPGVILLASIHPFSQPFLYIPAIPLAGASFVFLVGVEVILLKWLIVGRVHPGTYPVHGMFYIRNWFSHHLLVLALDLIAPLHATLYIVPWYRALGSKIGKFVELSTASTAPDLLEIGDESTVADEASLGVARVEGGWMTIRKTKLGRRTFLGNSAVVPEGTVLGNESLVGVLSLAPKPDDALRQKTTWLGSPPILLPRRQNSFPFSEDRTFRPNRRLRLKRAAIELCRVTIPTSGFIVVATVVIHAFTKIFTLAGLGTAFLMLPIVYALSCFALALLVVVAKWTIVGRFKPFAYPLWSTFIWRLEFVNALYEFLATPLILEILRGTPLLPWYLRILGAKIGRDNYINTTGFLEFDLVEIGDNVVLGEDCVIQTHLFEDRILKASKVKIGSDCHVGEKSVVLYDSHMEDGAKIDALSLVMKGETLPAGTSWIGIPAKRNNDQD